MTVVADTAAVPQEPDSVTSTTLTLAGEGQRFEKTLPENASVGDKTEYDMEKAALEASEMSEDEYPTGTKFIFIVVALVLAMFLLSLDMVSTCSSYIHHVSILKGVANSNRPSSLLLFLKSLKNLTVLIKLAGMVPHSF